jgi:hypothetical protein
LYFDDFVSRINGVGAMLLFPFFRGGARAMPLEVVCQGYALIGGVRAMPFLRMLEFILNENILLKVVNYKLKIPRPR